MREVIIGNGEGLVDPTQVLAVSSPANNGFDDGQDVASGASYLVVVIDPSAPGSGFVCLGDVGWWYQTPYEDPRDDR